jgi:membrane protease YdiL (CAAX protease family)
MHATYDALVKEVFFKTEKEAAAHINAVKGFDTACVTVMVVALVCMMCMQYLGIKPGYRMAVELLGSLQCTASAQGLQQWVAESEHAQIHLLFYWVCVIVVFYIGVPVLVIKFYLRRKLRDYGFGCGESFKRYPIYSLLLVVMVPLVILCSASDRFQQIYPFYKPVQGESLYPYFWIWQALYLVQFIAIEFFFRGFLLNGLKQRFGYYAIVVMTIPYCMIHFGKPMPEVIGAIFAGCALGALRLANRSIWMGVTIHYAIGFLMDIAALWRRGLF